MTRSAPPIPRPRSRPASAWPWRAICARMEERFRGGDHEGAAIAGIEAVSDLLAAHFPQDGTQPDEDELPNRPHLL